MKATGEALAILRVFADEVWHSYEEVEAAVESSMCRKKAIDRYLQGLNRPRDRPIEVQVAMGIRARVLCHLSNMKRSKILEQDGLKGVNASWRITQAGQTRLSELTKEES